MSEQLNCPLCNEANILKDPQREIYYFQCSVCGEYALSFDLFQSIKNGQYSDDFLFALAHHTVVNKVKTRDKDPILWFENDSSFKTAFKKYNAKDYSHIPIKISNKMECLLNRIADRVPTLYPFKKIKLQKEDMVLCGIKTENEVNQWMYTLLSKSYVSTKIDWTNIKDSETAFRVEYSISPEGWSYLNDIGHSKHSDKVFIAIAFRENPERDQIEQAIATACDECGFEANPVDRKGLTGQSEEHNNRIDDKIFADIVASRFLVAEFSIPNNGVYYEAGFAEGLGKPVIYVVKKTSLNEYGLHFDTRTINHVVWDDTNDDGGYADLRKKISNRIKGSILRKEL